MDAASAGVADLLQTLIDEQRRTTAAVEAMRLDLADQRTGSDVRLGLLLRAVHSAVGARHTCATELVELSAASLSTRIALRHAVETITGNARSKARSLGKFMAGHAGMHADGLRLVRVRGAVFRIETLETRGTYRWPI